VLIQKVIHPEDYGAKASNKNKDALVNYNAIKKVFKVANKTGGIIVFGSGTYITNELSYKDGIDFRNISIQGQGTRATTLKLANNRNEHLIESNKWFECFIKDIRLDGNYRYNTDSDCLNLSSGMVYAMKFDNVYFRSASRYGFYSDGGQHFTFIKPKANYNKETGIYIKDIIGATVMHSDTERNGLNGITIEGSRESKNRVRSQSPSIIIDNPYFEKNIGIILKSVCGVQIRNGYGGDEKEIFCSIESKDGVYSHNNTIEGLPEGIINIESGCYGNYIKSDLTKSKVRINDNDGNNAIGVNTLPFTESLFFVDKDLVKKSDLNSWDVRKSSTHNVSKKAELKVTTNDFKSSTITKNLKEVYSENTDLKLSLLAEFKCVLAQVRIYDTKNRESYNFETKNWQKESSFLSIPQSGNLELYSFPFNTKGKQRKIQIRYSITGVGIKGKSNLYYSKIKLL